MASGTHRYAPARPAATPGRSGPAEGRPLLRRRSPAEIKQDATAAAFAELVSEGWRVLHDVSLGHGRIDHVLVGPGGIAAIETHRRWGPVNVERLDEQLLTRIYTHAKLVTVTCGRAASPLLVFPWARVRPRGVSRRRGVDVLPLDLLAEHLRSRERRFSSADVAELVGRLRGAADPVG